MYRVFEFIILKKNISCNTRSLPHRKETLLQPWFRQIMLKLFFSFSGRWRVVRRPSFCNGILTDAKSNMTTILKSLWYLLLRTGKSIRHDIFIIKHWSKRRDH